MVVIGKGRKIHDRAEEDVDSKSSTGHAQARAGEDSLLINTLVDWQCSLCARMNTALNETCRTCGQMHGFIPSTNEDKKWRKIRKRVPSKYISPSFIDKVMACALPCFSIGIMEGQLISKSEPQSVMDRQIKMCCMTCVTCPFAGPCFMIMKQNTHLNKGEQQFA